MSEFPYPGLRPFGREEADIFFGRDDHIDNLLEKLGQTRFVAVFGPSGFGKSSLVRAGLYAALETGFLVSAGPRWRIAEILRGDMFQPAVSLDGARDELEGLTGEGFDDDTARRRQHANSISKQAVILAEFGFEQYASLKCSTALKQRG